VKVAIVGKTHMGNAACVGAIALEDGESLRLLTAEGYNHPGNTQYDVGQVWDIEFTRVTNPRPPHVEDVLVTRQRRSDEEVNLKRTILRFETPWTGSPQALFDRLVRATANGSGYVAARSGLPDRSTGYWTPDEDLKRQEGRYLYPSSFGMRRRLTYVGFAPMTDSIPAGALVRVSLARWWRPEDADEDLEERCYVQLSGWYP
jgi:hypothetical protein